MHELSLIQGILDILQKEQEKHGFTRVISIEIECGEFNCLSEESLQFYFDLAACPVFCKGARIRVHRVITCLRCRVCRQIVPEPTDDLVTCPECRQGASLVRERFSGIRVRDLEVE